MALAVLGLIFGSTLLLACIIVLAARATRSRRAPVQRCDSRGSTSDSSWASATFGGEGTDCSADAGACDGGGGSD